jgi:alanine dehydrogenase
VSAPKAGHLAPVKPPTPEERAAQARQEIIADALRQARDELPSDPKFVERMAEIAARKIAESDAAHAHRFHGWRGTVIGGIAGAGLALLGVSFISGDLAQRLVFMSRIVTKEQRQERLTNELQDKIGGPE